MPPYLFNPATLQAIWPIPIVTVIIAFVLSIIAYYTLGPRLEEGNKQLSLFTQTNRPIDAFIVILAFCMLGMVAGILSGLSRESVIGAVLPPVLSLVAGLALYLMGKDRLQRILVALAVIGLSFDLLIGSMWGAVLRETSHRSEQAYEFERNIELHRAVLENDVNIFRETLGLPPKTDFEWDK